MGQQELATPLQADTARFMEDVSYNINLNAYQAAELSSLKMHALHILHQSCACPDATWLWWHNAHVQSPCIHVLCIQHLPLCYGTVNRKDLGIAQCLPPNQ